MRLVEKNAYQVKNQTDKAKLPFKIWSQQDLFLKKVSAFI